MAEMRNVVLARVDDRLIHGEVVTAWTPTFKANKIIIIDDEVAKDTFNVRVVKALAPAGTKVIVYNVEKAAEKLMVQGVPGERLLLLAKTPTTYNRLIKAGVPLKEVNLGFILLSSDLSKAAVTGHHDPNTGMICDYLSCTRFSRLRKGDLFLTPWCLHHPLFPVFHMACSTFYHISHTVDQTYPGLCPFPKRNTCCLLWDKFGFRCRDRLASSALWQFIICTFPFKFILYMRQDKQIHEPLDKG